MPLINNARLLNILFIFLIIGLIPYIIVAQNINKPIAFISNDNVNISLLNLIPFNSSNNKDGFKFHVAEVLIKNISDNFINMGAEYSMNLILVDSNDNEYKSGIKGAGIISEFLNKFPNIQQDPKSYSLSFSDKFPPKIKAQSFLCGYEVPENALLVKFGVKKKNLFAEINIKKP